MLATGKKLAHIRSTFTRYTCTVIISALTNAIRSVNVDVTFISQFFATE